MRNLWLNKAKRRNLADFLNKKFGHRKFMHDGMTEAETAEVGEAFFHHKDYQDSFGWWLDEEGWFKIHDDQDPHPWD